MFVLLTNSLSVTKRAWSDVQKSDMDNNVSENTTCRWYRQNEVKISLKNDIFVRLCYIRRVKTDGNRQIWYSHLAAIGISSQSACYRNTTINTEY